MEFIDKRDIMKGIGSDTTADLLEKAMGHKYFKREGSPGNYKYYYTEAEYKKAKSKKTEGTSKESRSESKNIRVGQEVKIPIRQGEIGKVISTNKYITTVKFSDGSIRRYSNTLFEDVKAEDKENKSSETSEENKQDSFDWNSEDAKILAKKGITKDNPVVKGNLDLYGSSITSLPENLKVGGYLDLSNTPITSLPKGLEVGGSLSLPETSIISLPKGLEVGGHLYLSKTSITSLPEGLKVGGNLYLSGSPITSLPKGLEVGGSLDLRDTSITRDDFKDSMEIGGTISLDPKNKVKTKFKFSN
ncbi:MAG: hypothetical protein WC973_03690 [Candidatus Dojkabacteria bacterium]